MPCPAPVERVQEGLERVEHDLARAQLGRGCLFARTARRSVRFRAPPAATLRDGHVAGGVRLRQHTVRRQQRNVGGERGEQHAEDLGKPGLHLALQLRAREHLAQHAHDRERVQRGGARRIIGRIRLLLLLLLRLLVQAGGGDGTDEVVQDDTAQVRVHRERLPVLDHVPGMKRNW